MAVGVNAQMPCAPVYDDSTMWYVERDDSLGTGADVFYIVSTWEFDWKDSLGRVCHYADVWNAEHRAHMNIEQRKVAAYMGPEIISMPRITGIRRLRHGPRSMRTQYPVALFSP